mgnify:CR=1 FL=1
MHAHRAGRAGGGAAGAWSAAATTVAAGVVGAPGVGVPVPAAGGQPRRRPACWGGAGRARAGGRWSWARAWRRRRRRWRRPLSDDVFHLLEAKVFELSRPFDATEGWWAIGGCGAANWVSDNVFYLHYVFIAYNDQGSQAIVSARRQTTAIATQKITHRTILLSPHLGGELPIGQLL